MSAQPSGPGDAGNGVVLGGRYRILPDKPLPNFDTPTARAVQAVDERAPTRGLTALICEPGFMPRLDVIPQLSRLTRLPMINPVEAGIVPWPATSGRRFAVLFERTMGPPIATSPEDRFEPLREDQVIYQVLYPILPALKELNARSIKHRAIRADNVFYTDSSHEETVLGECVSGPPGYSQSVVYEPIDAAMANPSGRGTGMLADDMYALGVLIVVLLSGGNPVADLSDDEVIDAKIRHGSYTALVGDMRVSLTMMEPLRGLLCDDPAERWTFEDMSLWADGRHLSPKQPMLPAKAARALSFAGDEYWTRPGLSFAMSRHWTEAGALVSSGELANWLKRSFGDEESAKTLEVLPLVAGESAKGEDRLVSRALVVLEPTHPLRYRDVAFRIEGLTTALAIEYANADFRQAFTELMKVKLPQTYLQSIHGKGQENGPLMKTFDMITYFMDRPQVGNGLERALYETNRGWPCQSPLIADQQVSEAIDLLPALEQAARRASGSGEPMDRHIAAFCAARTKAQSDTIMRDLDAHGDHARRRLAIIHLLAEVRRVVGSGDRFPALTAWLAALMEPVIDSYHNREERARLEAEVARIGGRGDLEALYTVLNDPDARRRDADGFARAREEYDELADAIDWLSRGGLTASDRVAYVSQQASTLVSAVIAGLTTLVMTIYYVV